MVEHKCSFCEKVFCRKDNKDRHEAIHNSNKVECELCGQFVAAAALGRHQKTEKCKNNTRKDVVATKKIKIRNFQVEITESVDGNVTIKHDSIEIDGVKYVLIPESLAIANSNETPPEIGKN